MGRVWRRLQDLNLPLSVERRPEEMIWVSLQKAPSVGEVQKLGSHLREALERGRDRLVLDLKKLTHLDGESAKHLALGLKDYRRRIRLVIPSSFAHPRVAAWLAFFSLYHR